MPETKGGNTVEGVGVYIALKGNSRKAVRFPCRCFGSCDLSIKLMEQVSLLVDSEL